jgi:hypothetical protein
MLKWDDINFKKEKGEEKNKERERDVHRIFDYDTIDIIKKISIRRI